MLKIIYKPVSAIGETINSCTRRDNKVCIEKLFEDRAESLDLDCSARANILNNSETSVDLMKKKLLKIAGPRSNEMLSEGKDRKLEDDSIANRSAQIKCVDEDGSPKSLGSRNNVADSFLQVCKILIDRDLVWCKKLRTNKRKLLKNAVASLPMTL